MEFFKRKKPNPAAVQIAPSTGCNVHPFGILESKSQNILNQWKLYKTLREAVPVIDAAISKIIRLVGTFKIECEDEKTSEKINKFMESVQVNSCSGGVSNFILSYLNQLLTYGTAVGEMVVNYAGDDIDALYNVSLCDVVLETDESPLKLKIYYKDSKGNLKSVKYPQLILISTLNSSPGQIYGDSILKGLPFVSDILLKIYHSIGINWERIGNVRFAVTYKPSSDAGERSYSRERASQIASEWSKAMKSSSQPSDFIAVGDVDIKVIGADNQILESQVPVRQMLEQIISKLSIPPFLLGLNWSTTETMSTQQAQILSSELDSYRRILNPIISKICDMWMRLHGCVCEYSIKWNAIDLKDSLQIANTRLINARAEEIEKRIKNSYEN